MPWSLLSTCSTRLWHHCYCGERFHPNICLHNNISEKYPASHAFCINRSSITTQINKPRWHVLPNSAAIFNKILLEDVQAHSISNTIKKKCIIVSSHLWCRYRCCSHVARCSAGFRYKGCRDTLGLTKSRQTHPVFSSPPHVRLGNSMRLLALSGTSGVASTGWWPEAATHSYPDICRTKWHIEKKLDLAHEKPSKL